MDFRTKIQIPNPPFSFSYKDRILSLGSCFAQSIGSRLVDAKFSASVNPLGIIFNPHATFKILHHCIQPPTALAEDTFVWHQGRWYNYDTHSSFSHPEQAKLHQAIIHQFEAVNEHLRQSNLLILTWGTSYIYRRKMNGKIVSNCHKQAAQEFQKELLPLNQIIQEFKELYQALQQFNPQLKWILTLSPIRHIKDSLVLNSVSKANLRLACHQLAEEFDNLVYFPSYEILMDELRDYRFYGQDMIHPSPLAEEYIWEKFTETFLDAPSIQLLHQWNKLKKSLAHRAFHPTSESHQLFLRKLLEKMKPLGQQIDLSQEIQEIRQQLID